MHLPDPGGGLLDQLHHECAVGFPMLVTGSAPDSDPDLVQAQLSPLGVELDQVTTQDRHAKGEVRWADVGPVRFSFERHAPSWSAPPDAAGTRTSRASWASEPSNPSESAGVSLRCPRCLRCPDS